MIVEIVRNSFFAFSMISSGYTPESDIPPNPKPIEQRIDQPIVGQTPEGCLITTQKILCGNFQLKRYTPDSDQYVDILPFVANWRSLNEWRDALTQGWRSGTAFLGIRECQILDTQDHFFSPPFGVRRVLVESLKSCLPDLP